MTTAAPVRPERILKDLARLWVQLSEQAPEKGVLRACAMTLIVALEAAEDTQDVSETLAGVFHDHPSRAIVLRVSPDGGALDANVSAQCWMPVGRRQQICCEQIEITSPEDQLIDLPKLAFGLIAPDLPVVIWPRGERLSTHAGIEQLFPLAGKIILDTSRFSDPAAAYARVRDLSNRGIHVADLEWTRLTHLRELVAQLFESERCRGSVRRIGVLHGGEVLGVPARYLMGWFRSAMPSAEVAAEIVPSPAHGVTGVHMTGDGFDARIDLEPGAARITVNGLERRISMPPRSEQDLLREELSVLGDDPVFRKTLQ